MRDARVVVERCRNDHCRTNGCDGPDIDEPALGIGRCLPFEVGCPAFTRELRQVRSPSVRTFKLEIPEKYDGRLNPAEFLSIYTFVVCQLLSFGTQVQCEVLVDAPAGEFHFVMG